MKETFYRIPEEVQVMKFIDTDESIIEAFEWINNEDTSGDEKERRDILSFIRNHKEIEYFAENGVNKVPFKHYIVKDSNGKISSYSEKEFNKLFTKKL